MNIVEWYVFSVFNRRDGILIWMIPNFVGAFSALKDLIVEFLNTLTLSAGQFIHSFKEGIDATRENFLRLHAVESAIIVVRSTIPCDSSLGANETSLLVSPETVIVLNTDLRTLDVTEDFNFE